MIPPIQILIRALAAMFCIFFALEIMEVILNIFKSPYNFLKDDPILVSSGGAELGFVNDDMGQNIMTAYWNVVKANFNIFSALVLIMIAWNYFKLALEAVERYLMLGILTFTSPLAFSLITTKRTAEIFGAWVRMVFSQCLLLIFNLWFLKGFDAALMQVVFTSSDIMVGGETLQQGSSIAWQFALLAFLKLGQRIDSYLNTLGLNAAHTGGLLAMELGHGFAAAGNAMRGITKGISKGAAGTGGTAGQIVTRGGMKMPAAMSRNGKTIAMQNSLAKGAAFTGRRTGEQGSGTLSPRDTSLLMKSGLAGIGGKAAENTAKEYMPNLFGDDALGENRTLQNVKMSEGVISGEIAEKGVDGKLSATEFSAQLIPPGGQVPEGMSLVEAADGTLYAVQANGDNAMDTIHRQQEYIDRFNHGEYDVFSSDIGFTQGSLQNEGDGIITHTFLDASGHKRSQKLFASSIYSVEHPDGIVTAKNGMKYYAVSGNYEIRNDSPEKGGTGSSNVRYK